MAPARTPPVAVKKFLRAGERGSELFPMKFLNVEFKLEHYTHATNDSATSEQKSGTIFLAMHCTQLAGSRPFTHSRTPPLRAPVPFSVEWLHIQLRGCSPIA